jgi:hypothetical protein
MPIDNAVAEQINTNQEDPFRRVLPFAQLGAIQNRNTLMNAQAGEAGARAAEANASTARINLLTQQQPDVFRSEQSLRAAQTGHANAETQDSLARVSAARAEIGGRIANMIKGGATPDEVHDAATSWGYPIPDEMLDRFKKDPAAFQRAGANLTAGGMSAAEATQPHPYNPYTQGMISRGQMIGQPAPAQPGQAPPPSAPSANQAGTVSGARPSVMPLMTPREQKAEQDAAGADSKYTAQTTTDASAARDVNYTLGNIYDASKKFPTGRGMASTMEGRAWLQSLYDNFPGAKNVMRDPGKDAVAAYDDMLKNSGQLTRQALMQTHERAAIAYKMIESRLPGPNTSQGGLDRVVPEWQGLNDSKIAKQQIMAQSPVAGRSDKFEAE